MKMGNRVRKKKPRIEKPPLSRKIRKVYSPEEFDKFYPCWNLCWLDINGRWGWAGLSKTEWWNEICAKLILFEKMTWSEIKRNRKNHSIYVGKIVKEAQQYIIDRGLEQHDQVFSLRLTGKKRVYGIRTERVFNVLWYDPNHEICPAHLKHT